MSNPEITSRFIKDNAIITAKIAADAVTNAKLATDAVTQAKIANDAVGTAEIINDNVTLVKIAAAARAAAATASVLVERDAAGRAQFADPSAASDAATRGWVLSVLTGSVDSKPSVTAATTAALPAYTRVGNTITANANGAMPAIDSVTLTAGKSFLLNHGAAGADNGLYDVINAGAAGAAFVFTRRDDADTSADVTDGMFVPIAEGATYAGRFFRLTTNDPITLNTTALSFSLLPTLEELNAGVDLTYTPGSYTLDHDDSGVTAGTYDMAKVVVNARGHVTSVTARQFSKHSLTALGGETTLATGANCVAKSSNASINGSRISEEHGNYSINNTTGLVTFATALEAGDKVEVQVVRDA